MSDNSSKVQAGFRILLPPFVDYLVTELIQYNGKDYWWREVLFKVPEAEKDLPIGGPVETLKKSLDIAICLKLFDRNWTELFKKKLAVDYRTWAKELFGVRNRLSHIGTEDFTDNDAWRALDTMALLCGAFDDEAVEKIREIQREMRYGPSSETASHPAPTKKDNVFVEPQNGLPSWRNIIKPHPDVAEGRYKGAEFAANLSQVARGNSAIEYKDPVEFFKRTYITAGLSGLLLEAVKRIADKGGEPVIQLKTSFGGGKTHSMIALYHMLSAKVPVDKIPSVKPILEQAGLNTLYKANVAVLVGTDYEPSKSRRPNNFPGITINTLWGEMAAQLAESAGDPKLYDYVKEADKKGVSPGSEALKNLFDACGPCLILMDELVAYAKKLYGVSGLPAGSFDNFITFIQEITEAAKASKNSLVVASIPESDIEIGGEGGQKALASIEHTFGRMDAIWKPVAANEGFEVVRRRLFLECDDTEARDKVCTAFSQYYAQNKTDFPIEASEPSYRDRLISCYPIHPEIFDRLYNEWSTLEKFQRTRGVLRFMASVIHKLCINGDANAMILPGSIPFDEPDIAAELTKHLGNNDNWNAIIDSEIDGKNSRPYSLESGNSRFSGKMIPRRLTRTIFLGSAPTVSGQSIRGLEIQKVRLGSILPGDNIAEFNDALANLKSNLSYLYTDPNGDRYWFDTRPTLKKMVEDRANSQVTSADAEYELTKRLSSMIRKDGGFDKPHICPSSSMDIPDDQNVRLVILSPNETYKPTKENSQALAKAQEFLDTRGNSPRQYRNMLIFVAPDDISAAQLIKATKTYLAWKSIDNDKELLNLDLRQSKECAASIAESEKRVNSVLMDTYCWMLIPSIDRNGDISKIEWEALNIRGGNQTLVQKAYTKLTQDEMVLTGWNPALLKIELDNVLWKDAEYISIKTLWDDFLSYCYLPRLKNYDVLSSAISRGVAEGYFAYAAGITDDEYLGLKLGQTIYAVEKTGYLVRKEAAEEILNAQKQAQTPVIQTEDPTLFDDPQITPPAYTGEDKVSGGTISTGTPQPGPAASGDNSPADDKPIPPTRFYLSANIDPSRLGRTINNIINEVLVHLTSLDDCDVEITLEASATSKEGFDSPTIRTVSENCKTLKVDNFGFEKE